MDWGLGFWVQGLRSRVFGGLKGSRAFRQVGLLGVCHFCAFCRVLTVRDVIRSGKKLGPLGVLPTLHPNLRNTCQKYDADMGVGWAPGPVLGSV